MMNLIIGQIYPLMKKMMTFKYKIVSQEKVCTQKNKILKKKREKHLKN
jgi:hypothetical protein